MGARRAPHELPPIGTPEHTALLSGSIDLSDLELAGWGDDLDDVPPSGITASWLLPDAYDPHAPAPVAPAAPAHGSDAPAGSGAATAEVRPATPRATHPSSRKDFPSRRSLRATSRPVTPIGVPLGLRPTPGPVGKPLSGDVLGLSALLSGARGSGDRGAARGSSRPAPPVVAGPPTGALRMAQVQEALGESPALPEIDDLTATGELVRPFVEASRLTAAEWHGIDSVPPPVSVDVFQQSVRASLKSDALQAGIQAAEGDDEATSDLVGSPLPNPTARTRRQMRARDKAANSPRAVAVRRIAKGSVLAVTALGVVGAASPQAFDALGMPHDSGPLARNTMDFRNALAPHEGERALTPAQLAQQQELASRERLRLEFADLAADDAQHAATGAGAAMISLAHQNDAAAEARRQAEIAHAAREAARDPKRYAEILVSDQGWGDGQFQCLDRLWARESMWNYRAQNASSGAYGIPQALPGSKMASVAADWQTNPITQMKWGVNYISNVYGTPCSAWAHSQQYGWY